VTPIQAVISDFGGVLTSPLLDSFAAFERSSGITGQELGTAIGAIWERAGENPLFELETGRITEAAFLEQLGHGLTESLGREIHLRSFTETFFAELRPNERMIDYMRELKGRGRKLAICTNNVREWEARWRAMLPIDEIFDTVVDSAFVGMRKPDPEIYRLTLERLGAAPAEALFVDDVELNCEAAGELGIRSVWFRETEQAIAEIEDALRDGN
jgi:putative hydrolase of the HAD superfamily